ncbi:hypothetical protein RR46_00332 [Papilio xuthus]|uniref:Uncharacterized protein n=1 Tax=Papilio xuthus TaxID=66420 RepID=A0A0N0PA53_PAPXU|nr:hypothetical protein RR46_00332 [Papilio xuthus]
MAQGSSTWLAIYRYWVQTAMYQCVLRYPIYICTFIRRSYGEGKHCDSKICVKSTKTHLASVVDYGLIALNLDGEEGETLRRGALAAACADAVAAYATLEGSRVRDSIAAHARRALERERQIDEKNDIIADLSSKKGTKHSGFTKRARLTWVTSERSLPPHDMGRRPARVVALQREFIC